MEKLDKPIFIPRLDNLLLKLIKNKYKTLDTAKRKDHRISMIFKQANVESISELSEKDKVYLIELLKAI